MATSTSSVIGVNLTQVDDSALFPTGTLVNLSDGGQAMYIHASASALSTYAAVSVDENGVATMLTATNANTNPTVAFAQVSIATSAYGWVHLGGKVTVNLAAQCADQVPLWATSTAGVLDDATASVGYINGVMSVTTISNATAVTCIARYPHATKYGASA